MNQSEINEALKDVETREAQLRLHIIRSEEYVRHYDREFKRQVLLLYISIALLLLFQSWFIYNTIGRTPWEVVVCVSGVSFLAVVNCVLMIRTKSFLQRINEAWIAPQEKIALDNVREEQRELKEKLAAVTAT